MQRRPVTRAVEVVALLGDVVQCVAYLASPVVPRIGWALIVAGWVAFTVGLIAALLGQPGMGAAPLFLGLGIAICGASRLRHQRSPHFSIGEDSAADLRLATTHLPVPRFPLVESTGHGFVVNLPESMRGTMISDGQTDDVAQLASLGPAPGLPRTSRCPLPRNARLDLELGEHSFVIRSGVPPPRPADAPLAARIWSREHWLGLSLLAHMLMLSLVFSLPPPLTPFAFGTAPVKALSESPESQRSRGLLASCLELLTRRQEGFDGLPDDVSDRLLSQTDVVGERSLCCCPPPCLRERCALWRAPSPPNRTREHGPRLSWPRSAAVRGYEIASGRIKVLGTEDTRIVRDVIFDHIDEVTGCYDGELWRNRDPDNWAIVGLTITPAGRVAFSRVQSSVLDSVARSCIERAVRRWRLPLRGADGIVVACFPLVWSPRGASRRRGWTPRWLATSRHPSPISQD